MTFIVRELRRDEHAELIALMRKHFPHLSIDEHGLMRRIARGGRFFVAESNGRLIGFADLHVGKLFLLRGLAVDEEHRGKGVGTALMERVVAEVKRLGGKRLYLKARADDERALRFYRRAGFIPLKLVLGPIGETLCVMRKDLEN